MPTMLSDRSIDEHRGDDGGRLLAVHSAIVSSDPKRLREACKRAGERIDARFTEDIEPQHAGMTPLALAAALNKLDLVRVLLDQRANVNQPFANLRTTALMTSSFHGHVGVVRLLIERGADARMADLQGSTALGYCFGGSKNQEVVDMLIRAGVDVNKKNMLGMNALLLVAGYGNDELIRAVLSAGADPNSTNDFGHSALHLAVVGKRSQIAGAVSGGASALYGLNRRELGQVMKDWANQRRDLIGGGVVNDATLDRIGRFMTGVGEKLMDDPDGLSSDDQEAVKKRLDAVNRYRQDSMLAGKPNKKPGVMDTLMSCGGKRGKQAKSSAGSAPAERPLPQTSGSPEEDRNVAELCERFARIVRLLVSSGCRVDLTEKTFGMTALDMAILLGDIESVVLLSSAGADPDHLMKLFALSDLYACIAIKPDKKRVREILNNDEHVDVNASFSNFNVTRKSEEDERLEQRDGYTRGDEGLTPLTIAGKAQDNRTVDIIKLLIKQGADIKKIGPGGRSPLGEASRLGNVRMVEYLVGQGAEIEQPNPAFKQATPLIIAVISKQTAVVEYLLSQGAKMDMLMSDGRSALDKAMESSDMPMIDTLLDRCELSKNFTSAQSLPYRLAEQYKRPDRNIESILNQISDNVRVIGEREREKEEQRERENQALTSHVDHTDGERAPRGAKQVIKQQQRPPTPQSSEEEEEMSEEEESEMDIPEPPPPSKQGKKSKSSNNQALLQQQQQQQQQLLLEQQQQELEQQKKAKKKQKKEQELLEQQRLEQERLEEQKKQEKKQKQLEQQQQKQVTGKSKRSSQEEEESTVVNKTNQEKKSKKIVNQPPPPPPPPESESEDDDDDDDDDDDEEEEPRLELATNAGLKGVAKYPPSVNQSQVVKETVYVVKGDAGTSSVTKTTVTRTVVTSQQHRAQIVQAESSEEEDDTGSEEESEEESESEEEEEDVNMNKKIENVKESGKSKKSKSAETDI